jgi:hypothetical protein
VSSAVGTAPQKQQRDVIGARPASKERLDRRLDTPPERREVFAAMSNENPFEFFDAKERIAGCRGLGYPVAEDREKISRGERRLRWRPDGRGIYYLSLNSDLYLSDVGSVDSTFVIGENRQLFDASSAIDYDVSPDGKRLLLLTNVDQHQMSPLTLLTNWTALAEDKRR